MKFIFDFDDVLFHSTKLFKEHMYKVLEEAGIPRILAEKSYEESKRNEMYWLKSILKDFSINPDLCEEILKESKNFINTELLDTVKKLGKENCFIISYGNHEFQYDKIKRTQIEDLFTEIVVVSGSKKDAIEKICAKYKDEKVIFVDDKAKHFEDLDFKKFPNLKTILYDEKGLEKITSVLSQS